jgi:chromosome segregation ATPase
MRKLDDGVRTLTLTWVCSIQVQEDRTSLQSKVKELQEAMEQWETKEAQWKAREAQRASEASASAATAELQAALCRSSELQKTVEALSGQLSDVQATAATSARRLQESQQELAAALTKVGEGERATVRLQSELRVAMEDGMAAERRAQVRHIQRRAIFFLSAS